jgi:transcription termination/antitermination protein NusG
MSENMFWFAVKVREKFEGVVSKGMNAKNIETFLPTYSVRRRWSDRVKMLSVPLFPGYAFCRLHPSDRRAVLTIPGVHYVVGFGREPAPLEESEIESIRTLVRSGADLSPRRYLVEGERVCVEDGPLRGVVGVFLRTGNRGELVVSIQLLRRSVSIAIAPDLIAPLRSSCERRSTA